MLLYSLVNSLAPELQSKRQLHPDAAPAPPLDIRFIGGARRNLTHVPHVLAVGPSPQDYEVVRAQVGQDLTDVPIVAGDPAYVSRAVDSTVPAQDFTDADRLSRDAAWDELVQGSLADVNAAGDEIIAQHTADAIGERRQMLASERNRFTARVGRFMTGLAMGGARRLANSRIGQSMIERRENPATYTTSDMMYDYGVQRTTIDVGPKRQPKHRADDTQ